MVRGLPSFPKTSLSWFSLWCSLIINMFWLSLLAVGYYCYLYSRFSSDILSSLTWIFWGYFALFPPSFLPFLFWWFSSSSSGIMDSLFSWFPPFFIFTSIIFWSSCFFKTLSLSAWSLMTGFFLQQRDTIVRFMARNPVLNSAVRWTTKLRPRIEKKIISYSKCPSHSSGAVPVN